MAGLARVATGPETSLASVVQQLQAGKQLLLFLDYDGTLVPIARTPAEARPDAPLLTLLAELSRRTEGHAVILSGRPLQSLADMLPVPGLTLAGIYGLEIRQGGATLLRGGNPAVIQPVIRAISRAWSELVAGRPGFLVEDKGLAVALHSRWAPAAEARLIEPQVRVIAQGLVSKSPHFRFLEGEHFFEVVPSAADKGQTVNWFLDQPSSKPILAVYLGDDDKDEAAFEAVRRRGGVPVGVGQTRADSRALAWVRTPLEARAWLRELMASLPTAGTGA
jgi:trehalose 6-phosphate phosphatase